MARGETAVEGRLLGRAAEIGRVLARHLREARSEDASDATRARRLRAALEELGPTFAKLGQIASTRADLLPVAYVVELEQLQDRVPPMQEAEVVAVMERALGVPWEDVFESIEPTPLAAGTIGQVHRATLEGGERVVVKVQRATAADDVLRDLGLLEAFAARIPAGSVLRRIVDVPAIVDHLASSLRRELDFRLEAANADRLPEAIAGYPLLGVPRIHHGLTSARLLVMELVDGVPIREAPAGDGRRDAARQLLESYYRQILEDGFFHADPHPGTCSGRTGASSSSTWGWSARSSRACASS
ncbi:MAG: AarF/ABC1/UbiB kinase family protein [Thermoleophilia bacterium]